MDESTGTVTMTKSFFQPIFKVAFDKAFTENNIQSAFRKAGIWPTDGINVIKAITRPVIIVPEKPTSILKALQSPRLIRQFQISYAKDPTEEKVKTLFTTTIKLSA